MQEIKSSVLCCLTDLVKLDNVAMIAVCDEKKSSSEDATKSGKPKKEQDLVRKRNRNKTLTSEHQSCPKVNYNQKFLASVSYPPDPNVLTASDKARISEDPDQYRCYFTAQNPKYIATISYPSPSAAEELSCQSQETSAETNQSLSKDRFACHIVARDSKYLVSISYPTSQAKEIPYQEKSVSEKQPEPNAISTTKIACKLVTKDPKFLSSISFPKVSRSDPKPLKKPRVGRIRTLDVIKNDSNDEKIFQNEAEWENQTTTKATDLVKSTDTNEESSKKVFETETVSRHCCLIKRHNPKYLASITYPSKINAPKSKPKEDQIGQQRKRSYLDEMQEIGRTVKEKGIEDNLVSRRLLRYKKDSIDNILKCILNA